MDMDQFISRETLNLLSYCSTLGHSLKQISLRATPLETILDDIAKYRSSYIDVLVQENLRSISGAISMFIDTKSQRWERYCIRNILLESSRQSRNF